MGNPSYANLDVHEGTLTGNKTITFSHKPRRIIITNDSASNNLEFKFNDSESYATLKPTETITLDIAHKIVLLQGSSVSYRIWGIG